MSSRWKERNAKTRRDCGEENPRLIEEGALAWDRQLCLGQWQWTRRSWRQPQEIQRERKESKKTSETLHDTWLGGTQRGSLWLRNGKVRSQVSDIDRSRFPRRRTVGKARRGGRRGRRASDRVKKRVYRFRIEFR